MVGAHNKGQAVAINRDGAELHRVGTKGDNANLEGAQVQFLGNVRGQHAVYRHADVRKLSPEPVDGRQQIHAGVLVGGQLQPPALQALELVKGAGGFTAQGQQAQGIIAQQHPGSGQRTVPRRPVKERLARRRLQLADHLAHRRLRPVQADRRAREAVLLGYCQKGFQLAQFHSSCQFSAVS